MSGGEQTLLAKPAKAAPGRPPPARQAERRGPRPPAAHELFTVASRRGAPLQAKLAIGRADDPLELEADRVAERVMAAPAGTLRRTCACGGEAGPAGECAACKARRLGLQRRPAGPGVGEAPPIVERVLRSPGRSLDSGARQFMEPRFGHDLGGVRVHTDSEAAASADAVGAHAYTVGDDIVFAAGRYAPSSAAGRTLLAHELTHVVQQRDSPRLLQRACLEVGACPLLSVELNAYYPLWLSAERCLQESYRRAHPGNTIGFNDEWQFLVGRDPAEVADLACFQGNFVADSGTHPAEPDIFDFTATAIYEITTRNGVLKRRRRLAWQVSLANQLAHGTHMGCSGRPWFPGYWGPSPCYWLGGDMYMRAWNEDGLLLYQLLRDISKELLTATVLAAMLAAMKKGGTQAAAKALGGRLIPAYAVASLLAMAVTLASGKAEAHVGPGDEEPIETMFKALAASGTPVPPELRAQMEALMAANPALKDKIERSLRGGGSATAAQEEINKQILQILRDNPDAFSAEDLEALTMAADSSTASAGGPATAEALRKALDDARAGRRGGGGGGTGAGSGSGTTPPTSAGGSGAAPPTSGSGNGTGTPASPRAALSPESRAWIDAASPGARRIFQAMVGSGGGPAVTDTVVRRLLGIVEPAHLTPPEVDELLARLGPIGSAGAEEALTKLEGTVKDFSGGRAAERAAIASGAVTPGAPSTNGPPPPTPQQRAEAEANRKRAKTVDVSGLKPGEVYFPLPEQLTRNAELSTSILGKSAAGKAFYGTVKIRIVNFTPTTVEIVILEASDLYDSDGTMVMPGGSLVGRTMSATRMGGRRRRH